MNPFPWLVFGLALASTSAAERKLLVHSFAKQQLTDEFWAEGAHFGDFNKDGHNDIASGPFWYEGPDFKKRNEFYPATQSFKVTRDGVEKTIRGFEGALSGKNAYSRNFLMFTGDYNSDGWTDIFVVGFPGEQSYWYENPKGKEGHWKAHTVINVTDNESASVGDITGDGKADLYCASEGHYGFATVGEDPYKPWPFTRISPNNKYHKFTHGIGIGDVNGDGKMDLLEKDGWWEQPKSGAKGAKEWAFHKQMFGVGGSQMYAYDFDGDGDNDVLTALAGHGYGIAWFEHVKENGAIAFKNHTFINKEPKENRYGVKFSQPHAIELFDMDNDGIKDIVTGKRFWAHGPDGDPEPNAPAVLYWFKTVRSGKAGEVDFVPFQIDNDSGVGTQVVAGKVDKDEWPDVIVGNKKGTFFFKHTVKEVSPQEWEAAQPKAFAK